MHEQITYYQKRVKCGQSRCKKCRGGNGHGPYWYSSRKEGHRTIETYIGPTLPPGIQLIGRTHQSPLVGREQELQQIHDWMLALEEAHRQAAKHRQATALQTPIQHVLLLEGEAGIGKTRLAEEVARFALNRNWTVLWERSFVQEQTFPYRPWIEVLRRAISQDKWLDQEMSNKPQIYRPLSTLLPDLSFSQDLSTSSRSPEQERLRLWEAVCELFMVMSTMAPLLIVLDDVQWADAASGELLAYLARHLSAFPVCFVGTCRMNELTAQHPLQGLLADLRLEGNLRTLLVAPLTSGQIRTLVTHQWLLPETLSRRIEDCTAGNPFFAEELAQTLKEAHHASGQEEWMFPLPLPLTVSSVLDQHLQHLSTKCLKVLEKASLLGRSFQLRFLCTLHADEPEDTIVEMLEEGLKSGVLAEEGIGSYITYHFRHPLLATHLSTRLSAARRALLHRRIADLLRQQHPQVTEEAAIITYHLLQGGGDPKLIVQYAQAAGDRAFALCAYPDAERYYHTVLSYLTDGNDTSTDAGQRKHLAVLSERLGECAVIQGKIQEAQHYYERVLDLRETISDQHQDAQLRALLWIEIGWTWRDRGERTQALHCSKRGEQILRDAGITGGPAWASFYYQQGSICWQEGRYEEALHYAQRSLTLFGESLNSHVGAERPAAPTRIQRTCRGDPVDVGRLHLLLAAIYASSGQDQDAEGHLQTALMMFEQYDCQRESAIACCNLGDLYLRQSKYTFAKNVLERAVTLSEQMGDLPNLVVALGNRSILAARLGDLPFAETSYKRVLTLAAHIGDPVYLSLFSAYLSATQRERGDLLGAARSLCQALKTGRQIANSPCIAFALVNLAQHRRTQALLQDNPRLLKRAKLIIEHVLTIEEMEAETRTEGYLVLAQVLFSLGDVESALHAAEQSFTLAHHHGLLWLLPRIQEVLEQKSAIVPAQASWSQE